LIGEIAATPKFDPKKTLEAFKSELLDCYRQARVTHPDLHGKLTLKIGVNEAGNVLRVDADPGGSANDDALVACLRDAMKERAQFQKPGGGATVVAPLVFRR
jgi:hypothetical protein